MLGVVRDLIFEEDTGDGGMVLISLYTLARPTRLV